MATAVQMNELTKRYGSTTAVNELSLEIEAGEVFGLLGPNGAGKSTTLYMLTGLVRPTSGTISILGRDVRKFGREVMSRVGVLVERPAFYDYLTVRKNLLLFSKLSGKEVTIDRALEYVGLRAVAHTKVAELSQGLRQRLGLAQAILTEPEVLILDEPTSGLDPEIGQEVLTLLRSLADESGVTVVLSSHQMNEMELLCDRVAIINEGRLVSCEETDSLLSYDTSNVEVLIDATDAASRRLCLEDWVESVETKPGRLYVRLRDGNIHQLNSFLVSAGYRVSGIIPRRRTLQEYFLKVMNS